MNCGVGAIYTGKPIMRAPAVRVGVAIEAHDAYRVLLDQMPVLLEPLADLCVLGSQASGQGFGGISHTTKP